MVVNCGRLALADQCALGHERASGASGDGRGDGGVAQIETGAFHVGLRLFDRRRRAALAGERVIPVLRSRSVASGRVHGSVWRPPRH